MKIIKYRLYLQNFIENLLSKVKINDNLNTRKQKKRYIEKMKNLKTIEAVYIYIYQQNIK